MKPVTPNSKPSKVPSAASVSAAPFEPISPAVNIPNLLATTPNFKLVQRIDARQISPSNIDSLTSLIREHVIRKGLPLVLENWHLRSDWPKWHFNTEWLKENHGSDHIAVRDIPNKSDMLMSLGHYLSNLGKLASKFSPSNYQSGKQQRLYGKDLDCPPVWRKSLANVLPSSTIYLNPKADLMSSLPPAARAENMMCYIGHEGTYTPAHKEMCASLGQNIMVYASQTGPNSEPGSSIWFMTGMADRDLVAEYWLGKLGHDIEVEAHFASLEHLQKAPFPVYIVEQKLGDYILVPPLAPHQVWNRGTCTMKAAWNRTTVDTLELALQEALPKARLVCRDEQYKNKNIIYDTLKRWTKILREGSEIDWKTAPPTIKEDYRNLFELFNVVLLDECFSPLLPAEKHVELIPNDYNVTCSFCRGNIFNRFLSCKRCIPHSDDGEPYDVCMDCYARGRSCYCISGLSWVEQYPWAELLKAHADFRSVVLELEGSTSKIKVNLPSSLQDGLPLFHRKTLARVCQEGLKKRPYQDPNVVDEPDDPEEFKKKRDSGEILRCHPCCATHPAWKTAICTGENCSRAYCYGNLWRAYDQDPFLDILSKFEWKCPYCQNICSCGSCRKRGKTNAYVPRGTRLGIITKHVSDPRSVESLVDFGKGNIMWRVDGVTGVKRKRSEDGDGECEPVIDTENGAVERWDSAVGNSHTDAQTTTATAERNNYAATDLNAPPADEAHDEQPFEPFEDSSENAAVLDGFNMFKADSSAAGLEVVQIPIDPALGGDGSGMDTLAVGLSESYARLFENPTTAFGPGNINQSYLYPTSHVAVAASKPMGVDENYHDSDMEEDVRHSDDFAGTKNTAHMDYDSNEDNDRMAPGPSGTYWASPDHHSSNNDTPQGDDFHQASLSAMLSQTAELSTLEKNPLAFLAAAGLLHSNQQESQGGQWDGSYFGDGSAMSANTAMEGYVPVNGSGNPAEQGYQNGDERIKVLESGTKGGSERKSGKRKADKIESDVFSSTLPGNRDSAISEWVFKQKKKNKKRKLKEGEEESLIVVLKISPDAWRRSNTKIEREKEEKAKTMMRKFGDGDVSTDLTTPSSRGRKRRVKQRSPSVEWKRSKSAETDPPVVAKEHARRGRPSKKVYVEIDTDDGDSVASGTEGTQMEGDTSSASKKIGRRSLRTGELVDGLDISAPLRRRTKKYDSTSVVGKSSPPVLVPETPIENGPADRVPTPVPVGSSPPRQESLTVQDLPRSPGDNARPDSLPPQMDDGQTLLTEEPTVIAEESQPSVSEEIKPSTSDVVMNDTTPIDDAPSASENVATETTQDNDSAEPIPFDVEGSVMSEESEEEEQETEEERRKRLVREALAEAKSAALLVVEGLAPSEAVYELQSSEDESITGDMSVSAASPSEESDGESIIPARAAPKPTPKTPNVIKYTRFEVVVLRRPPQWAEQQGYRKLSPEPVEIEQAHLEPASPNEASSRPIETSAKKVIGAIEIRTSVTPQREAPKTPPTATASVKSRGRPGRPPAHQPTPLGSEANLSETLLTNLHHGRKQTTPRSSSTPQASEETTTVPFTSLPNRTRGGRSRGRGGGRGRGRGRGQGVSPTSTHAEETVAIKDDQQQELPLLSPPGRTTPRARGRQPRQSRGGRGSAKQPSERPSSSPEIRPRGFTSINGNFSVMLPPDKPPVVHPLSLSPEKAKRPRGRPSRGARVSLPARPAPEEVASDDVFFREMLGGDEFSDDFTSSLTADKASTSRAKNANRTSVVEVKKSHQDDDDDDEMGWWD